MKISIKDVNSCEKILTIDIPQEVVEKEYDSFFAAVARNAKIPGFRPGHAPKHVVALHYRQEAREEVLKQLLSRSFREAIKEKELSPIGYPSIDQIEFDDKHLKFNAHVELKPQMKFDKYTGLALKREVPPVTTAEIDEVIGRILESRATFQPVEDRPAQLGDFLICTYRLQVDGKEIEKRENEWIEIRENDYLNGFSKQLIGTKSQEEREVVIQFPATYARKECAGKEGHFSVSVKEVKAKKMPVLDDEFVRESGTFQNVGELKDAIQKDIDSHHRDEAEVKLEKMLFDELIKKSKFDVPGGMVERRFHAILEERAKRMTSIGLKEDAVKQEIEKQKEEFRKEAEREIRISFILDEIAIKENIKETDEDVEGKFRSISERLHRPAEEIKSYYQEKEERMESIRAQVLNEKVIQWLKDRATIQELSPIKEGGK